MRKLIGLFAMLLFAGCTSVEIRPYDTLHSPPKPGWPFTMMGTIYVPPEQVDMYRNPPNTIIRAKVAHETVHAKRQLKMGGLLFALLNGVDSSFRWNEERLGYEAEIAVLAENGLNMASSYWRDTYVGAVTDSVYSGMVSRADAVAWYTAYVGQLKP